MTQRIQPAAGDRRREIRRKRPRDCDGQGGVEQQDRGVTANRRKPRAFARVKTYLCPIGAATCPAYKRSSKAEGKRQEANTFDRTRPASALCLLPLGLPRNEGFIVWTARSVSSSPRSMIANASRNSASVIAQRRIREERVPANERVQALVAEMLAERLHLRRAAVERRHRLHRRAIPDELDDAEEADRANGADRWMTRARDPSSSSAMSSPSAPRALDQAVLFVHRDASRARRARRADGCCRSGHRRRRCRGSDRRSVWRMPTAPSCT